MNSIQAFCQTRISVCSSTTEKGTYNLIMDVDCNGIFNADIDLYDSLTIDGPEMIPEFSSTTILLAMLIVLGSFVLLMRYRQKL